MSKDLTLLFTGSGMTVWEGLITFLGALIKPL